MKKVMLKYTKKIWEVIKLLEIALARVWAEFGALPFDRINFVDSTPVVSPKLYGALRFWEFSLWIYFLVLLFQDYLKFKLGVQLGECAFINFLNLDLKSYNPCYANYLRLGSMSLSVMDWMRYLPFIILSFKYHGATSKCAVT